MTSRLGMGMSLTFFYSVGQETWVVSLAFFLLPALLTNTESLGCVMGHGSQGAAWLRVRHGMAVRVRHGFRVRHGSVGSMSGCCTRSSNLGSAPQWSEWTPST